MAQWYTTDTPEEQERLLAAWPDAPLTNLEVCGMLLDVAREQVVAYAPAPEGGEQVPQLLASLGYTADTIESVLELLDIEPDVTPTRYVYAQLKQAENLWNAGRVASDGTVGVESFSFTPRPMDKTIKSIIRPPDGKPHVY
jgi:hypothetical protein